jgi:succinate-semialdehyde dehydrogenase/glutarate-semialdehyde dehydrogenase
MLQKAVRTLRSGHGFDPQSTQGPLIKSTAVDKVRRHVADALDKGATVVDGQQPSHDPRFYPPIVLRDVQAGMLITQEETFGPVAAVIRFEHEAEALQMANDTTAGLAAYVYTRDLSRTIRIAEALECGMVGVNSGAISTELAPFGGVKESGNSREGSHHGIEEFLQLKYVLIGGQG